MPVARSTTKVEYGDHLWVSAGDHASATLDRGVFDCALLRHQLRHTGEATLRMLGQSMSPLLPMGAMVKLRPVKPSENLRGAIVAMDWGPKVVVHRVIEARGATIVSQGLNAPEPDQAISRESIIGVVCHRDGWPVSEMHLRTAASAWTMSVRSLRALRNRW